MSKKSKSKGIKLVCKRVYEWKSPDMTQGYRLWAKSKKQAKNYLQIEVIPGKKVRIRDIERVGFIEPQVIAVLNPVSASSVEAEKVVTGEETPLS